MATDELLDPVAVAVVFAAALERIGVRYVIGGSFASSVHGEPRSTNDVDFVTDLRPEHAGPLVRALAADFYISDEAVRQAVADGTSFNAVHLAATVKVDVFVAGRDAFDHARIDSGETITLATDPPATLVIDSAEHTILRKLEWFRRGGETSERQWRDVVGIIRIQAGRIDQAHLELWAGKLGISDLLAKAAREAQR